MRDFHSFRVMGHGGVPLELVQTVTGHKTTDIALKNYVLPGREDFRRALQSAMPKLHTKADKSPEEEVREIVEGMTGTALKRDQARLLEMLGKG